jgi:hypothetical protein
VTGIVQTKGTHIVEVESQSYVIARVEEPRLQEPAKDFTVIDVRIHSRIPAPRPSASPGIAGSDKIGTVKQAPQRIHGIDEEKLTKRTKLGIQECMSTWLTEASLRMMGMRHEGACATLAIDLGLAQCVEGATADTLDKRNQFIVSAPTHTPEQLFRRHFD